MLSKYSYAIRSQYKSSRNIDPTIATSFRHHNEGHGSDLELRARQSRGDMMSASTESFGFMGLRDQRRSRAWLGALSFIGAFIDPLMMVYEARFSVKKKLGARALRASMNLCWI